MATVLRNLTFFVFLVLAVDAHRCDEETLLKQRWAWLGSLVTFRAPRNAMHHLKTNTEFRPFRQAARRTKPYEFEPSGARAV